MDIEASNELTKLIKQITETGDWTLDAETLKSIKSICKRSDANVDVAFDHWFAQLKKEHAQIRYSCVQLAEQLFQRSHRFRTLVADEFPQFIALTIGIRQSKLPPPDNVAEKLKQYSLALIQAWNTKFGTKYRPIAIGRDYLEHNGVLKSSQPTIDTIHSQDEERANRQTRMQPVYERRFEQIATESEEYLSIIKENLRQMEGCFEILIPKHDEASSIDFDSLIKGDLNASEGSNENPDTYKEKIRSHGIASSRYKLTIVMSDNPVADEVHESKENEVVYEQLREGYKLARTKHNKQLNEWVNSLARIEVPNKSEQKALLKKLLDVKAEMTEVIRKAELLNIHLPPDEPSDDEEYDDELFEEVEVPTRSSTLTKPRKEKRVSLAQRIFPLAFEPGMEDDVTYNRERVFSKESKSPEPMHMDRSSKGKKRATAEDEKKEELLKRAPVVEWGDDLFYWDKTDVQFNTSGIERSHRFMGVGEGTNEMPEHLLDELRKRTVYYKPHIPTNLKACRAPLRSGRLCPRRDLVTCPFHGKIIPRDELGRPVNENDKTIAESSSTTATEKELVPVTDNKDTAEDNFWQDIERDVMQQVDQPLIELNKQKRKRKKPQSNLADIRKKKETSYTRLKSKVEAPNTRRAIEEAQDYERSLKSRDKKMNLW